MVDIKTGISEQNRLTATKGALVEEFEGLVRKLTNTLREIAELTGETNDEVWKKINEGWCAVDVGGKVPFSTQAETNKEK